MRSLYLRIWLTVVAALALFAFVSGWMVQRHLEQERVRNDSVAQERLAAWADLLERSLPGVNAPKQEQAMALRDWSLRLRMPMALDGLDGKRIASSDSFARREADAVGLGQPLRSQPIKLDDGRTLWVMRPGAGGPRQQAAGPPPAWLAWRLLPDGVGLLALLLVLFVAVAAGAWPVVRRLTRRLESLKKGVDAFGRGQLHERVAEEGRDEVAALATSFNQAATRIEALLRSHQSLLANASHELRSPLARLKMALQLVDEASPAQRATLQAEISTNIAELDALVEEVLLASRLDAAQVLDANEAVELLGVAAEEAARVNAVVQGSEISVQGDERLLRRAIRNLLENARRYGGDEIEIGIRSEAGVAQVAVSDRGSGVPEAFRERIFEPFFRLPGHAERAGGVGLGLALVRQIAQRHGGQVRCESRAGGGSIFVLSLPLNAVPTTALS
jgi:signal transduction histidine kinase